MNNTINIIGKVTLFFICIWCLLSCGLESISYLENIPPGNYKDITGVSIRLPSDSAEGYPSYFDNFIIYYRIYISGDNPSGVIDNDNTRTLINPMLNNDYNHFELYTDLISTTVPPLTQDTFPNRGYYKLELEGADINRVLGSDSLGSNLEISFSTNTGVNPVLIVNGRSHTLRRAANGPGTIFYPRPNRYFLNHSELYDSSNAINPSQNTTTINADVYGRTQTSPPSRYTYVSMYITAQGTSLDMPPQTIYSQPIFLGIFRLADAN
jgi:hypothetical protein